jgi:predicted transcriptional regulator
MSDCTVRVDDEIGRLVGDLAHALGRTRKRVLRDAVLVFADLHAQTLARGVEASSRRSSAASGALEDGRRLAEVGGDLLALDLRERVLVMRREIVAVVERFGASEVRLIGELAEGRASQVVELLVTSDLVGAAWRHLDATVELQRLLDAPVEFTDATGLRLFRRDRLATLERAAVML